MTGGTRFVTVMVKDFGGLVDAVWPRRRSPCALPTLRGAVGVQEINPVVALIVMPLGAPSNEKRRARASRWRSPGT